MSHSHPKMCVNVSDNASWEGRHDKNDHSKSTTCVTGIGPVPQLDQGVLYW